MTWLSEFISGNGVFLYLLFLTTAGGRYSGETTPVGKQEEEKRLWRSGVGMQQFPGWVLLNTGSLLSVWCTPDKTSSCRCCLCASACWVGWKQVEERTDILLSGGGFCAKGLNWGNSCLWQRIYSQLLLFPQANSNKLTGVFETEKCTDKGSTFEFPKESQCEELEAVDTAILSIDWAVVWPISVYQHLR